MIMAQEIRNLAAKLGLKENIIEKDYVISWLLWGIGAIPELNHYWAFKGGTSIKKCYVGTWRFSEDLDFTVLPNGPSTPETIQPLINAALKLAYETSGVNVLCYTPSSTNMKC